MTVTDFLSLVVVALAIVAMVISRRLGDRVQSLLTILIGVLGTVSGVAAVVIDTSDWSAWVLLAVGLGSLSLGFWFIRRE